MGWNDYVELKSPALSKLDRLFMHCGSVIIAASTENTFTFQSEPEMCLLYYLFKHTHN